MTENIAIALFSLLSSGIASIAYRRPALYLKYLFVKLVCVVSVIIACSVCFRFGGTRAFIALLPYIEGRKFDLAEVTLANTLHACDLVTLWGVILIGVVIALAFLAHYLDAEKRTPAE